MKDGGCRCTIGRRLGDLPGNKSPPTQSISAAYRLICIIAPKIVAELDNGEYSEWKCSPEDIVMPMCGSPQISDALLRASKLPANDNRPAVRIGIKSSRKSKRTAKPGWQAILILCVATVLLL